jgi:hypothetical protein
MGVFWLMGTYTPYIFISIFLSEYILDIFQNFKNLKTESCVHLTCYASIKPFYKKMTYQVTCKKGKN